MSGTAFHNNIQVWSMHSTDDGATWSGKMVRHANELQGVVGGRVRDDALSIIELTGVGDASRRAVRVKENNTLVAVVDLWFYEAPGPHDFTTQPLDAGAHPAFIVCDTDTTSAATGDQSDVFFRRSENRGSSSWI